MRIGLFIGVILVTLLATAWAASRNRDIKDFYTAGGRISGLQNGLALAGDALSAGAFLGLTGLIFASGFDGFSYAIGYSLGMPIVIFLLAERLRQMGRYTFSDVACVRLAERPIRIFGALSSLVVVLLYLIAQMVGAGALIQLMFGLDYRAAILIVGVLMISYVLFGGMMATTWIQIIKACLMLTGGVTVGLLALRGYDFSFTRMLSAAAANRAGGVAILAPSLPSKAPFSTLSLGLALMFGTAGLPHILMRFFTVPDVRAARSSAVWATVIMSGFYAFTSVLGFGAIAWLAHDPSAVNSDGSVVGGVNMVAIHLARVVGGDALLGFVSAVAFATILAVVAGLTLAGASAVSHDLYARWLHQGRIDERRELRASRIAAVALGCLGIALGLAFHGENVAYMITLAFGVACSSTFPVLVLSIYWSKLTTRGAVIGGGAGLAAAVLLTVLGPSVWVAVLGNARPIVALDPPTLVTMPLAFLTCWVVSLLDRRCRSTDAAGTSLSSAGTTARFRLGRSTPVAAQEPSA
jgi:cation/acetate symporter